MKIRQSLFDKAARLPVESPLRVTLGLFTVDTRSHGSVSQEQ